MNLFDDLPSPVCRGNVPLGPLTWFKLGGPAEYLIEPRTMTQLAEVVRRCHETATPIRVLGMGANVLVPDEGVPGVVLRLQNGEFAETTFDGELLVAGAGVDLTKLVRAASWKGLAGLEQLAGIPGTVGGGVCMNCGGKYGDISTAVDRVRSLRANGEERERPRDELNFDYRRCALGDDFIVSVALRLRQTDPAALQERFQEIWQFKHETQPPLGRQSAGCIFRNPNGASAGQLIDRAGLKGFRIGSAHMSDRHANFAIADSGGRAADVRELITVVADRVAETFGVRLEPEVKIW